MATSSAGLGAIKGKGKPMPYKKKKLPQPMRRK
jgi:hypothetical protein